MAKFDKVCENLKEKGANAKHWFSTHKWEILKGVGSYVVYGLVGYGIGSLYCDVSGLRKATYDITAAYGYSEGYKAGLGDATQTLRAAQTESMVVNHQ